MFTLLIGLVLGIVGILAWQFASSTDFSDDYFRDYSEEYQYSEMPGPPPRTQAVANTQRSMNDVLTTMVNSWGGDAPQEIFWTLAELTILVNQRSGLDLEIPDEETYNQGEDAAGNLVFNQRLKALGDAMDDML